MKISVVEPLGITKETLLKIAAEKIGTKAEVSCFEGAAADVAEVVSRSKDADIVLLANMQYRKEVLEQCPNLKMISVAFTGVDHIDMGFCQESKIVVCNSAGYSNEAVSELVFGLALSLYRRIIQCDDVVRKGGTKDGLVGFELAGKKFGIIGTGAIGMKVAALAKAFGCEVFAYSRTKKANSQIQYLELDQLMSTCDIISLHVPLNENTKGMINGKKLAMMNNNAILINAARGPVVDYTALTEVLAAGKIAGAAIDVFEIEPPIPLEHPLFHAPNVIVAPHIGFATHEALEKRAVIAFENIKQWLAGTPQNVM